MSGYTAIVVELPDADGTVRIRRVAVEDGQGYEFLRATVGGWIEHICTEDGVIDFWMNDEGKLNGLPVNYVATDIFRAYYPWRPDQLWPGGPGEPFQCGNIVITGNRGPETASVRDGLWEELQAEVAARGDAWVVYRDNVPVRVVTAVRFVDETEG